jgi:hypothetical protein
MIVTARERAYALYKEGFNTCGKIKSKLKRKASRASRKFRGERLVGKS